MSAFADRRAGIAATLLIDLALHEDTVRYARRNNVSPQETEFRKSLLLGTFVYSMRWSLYLNRPITITTPVLRAVRAVTVQYSGDTTLYMWVQLCLHTLEVIEVLNEPLGERQPDRNLRLCSCEMELLSIFDGLPPEFSFDDSRIDELDVDAYGPYMQYFSMQITVHRAMIKAGEFNFPASDGLQPKSLDHMNTAMHKNAIRTARLVLSFQQISGVENMVITMLENIHVASVALISHILRVQQQHQPIDKDVRWLQALFQALISVEKHYPITRKMSSSLIQVVVNTPISQIFADKNLMTPAAGSAQRSDGLDGSRTMVSPRMATFQRNVATPRMGRSHTADLDVTFTTEDDIWMHDLT